MPIVRAREYAGAHAPWALPSEGEPVHWLLTVPPEKPTTNRRLRGLRRLDHYPVGGGVGPLQRQEVTLLLLHS